MLNWEKQVKDWVDSLKPSQKEILIKIISSYKDDINRNIHTKYDFVKIISDDNSVERIITGFNTWRDMLTEIKRLSEYGYKNLALLRKYTYIVI